MQTGREQANNGEIRPSVNKDSRLEDKIDDEKDEELTATIEEPSTKSWRCYATQDDYRFWGETMKPRNIDVNGKTRPTSVKGIATPKAKAHVEEAEGIIKGDVKKMGEAVMRQNRKT
jgi:hypothetical protein